MQTLKGKFPKLHAALFTLAIANQSGGLDDRYVFPKEAEDAFPDAEGVLCKLTEEETETIIDGERGEAEAILARFGNEGKTLDGLLSECFQGEYQGCLAP